MSKLVDRETAVARLQSAFETHGSTGEPERVPVDTIAGRVVEETVTAPSTVPERPFATMDGFALASADTPPRPIEGAVESADDPGALASGTAVRIATGAPLPEGADAVIPIEEATTAEGELLTNAPAAGTNTLPDGTTASEGEALFESGDQLAARHAALLSDVGIDRLKVRPRRSVGVLPTGTEIVRGEQPDRDSAMLANLLRNCGTAPTVLDPVPDEVTEVTAALDQATDEFDLVVTTGGTSVGADDHVSTVLAEHDPVFAGLRLRPGRPTTAAVVDGTVVCACPGKPLAAYVAATMVLRPALVDDHELPTVSTTAATRIEFPATGFEYAVPVHLRDGSAVPAGQGTSPEALYGTRFKPGRVASNTRLTLADGLLVVEEMVESGDKVPVVPYEVIE